MTNAPNSPAVPTPARPSLPTATGGAFPIRRIYCIGRNYADHAREMGGDPQTEPPFFFQKNPENAVADGVFVYPPGTSEVHHEVELVVALQAGGRDIAEAAALDCVWGYGVGFDMTLRDRQAAAKAAGRPWDLAKAFDGSAPMGPLQPVTAVGHPSRGRIAATVNNAPKQVGDLDQMIWPVAALIAEISRWHSLAAGDLIMTGTPAGVGPVLRGDLLRGEIEGVGALTVQVK